MASLIAVEARPAMPVPMPPAPDDRLVRLPRQAAGDTSHAPRFESRLRVVLERPLFSPTRRPSAFATATAPANRLSAIVIGPATRVALFVRTGSDRTIVLHEGERLDTLHVRRIDMDGVLVDTPEGIRRLQPTRIADHDPGAAGLAPATIDPDVASLIDTLHARTRTGDNFVPMLLTAANHP